MAMANQLLPEAAQYTRQNRLRRVWRKFVQVMACIVVFCTTYALILPAITMEKDPVCGLEEHIHSESCCTLTPAQQITTLNCTYESLGVHSHTPECYDADNNLQCGLSDFLLHVHDASCADEAGTIVCALPEVTGHSHTEACFETAETGESLLVCGQEARILHSHTAECFDAEGVLICTQPVLAEHIHTETCFTVTEIPASTTLSCGLEEHSHTDGCYAAAEPTIPAPELLSVLKPDKDNTDQLDIVETADTMDLIEIDLFNYTDRINDFYLTDPRYPGFLLDPDHLGSIITADPAAGIVHSTEKTENTVNAVTGAYDGIDYGSGNLPLEGAMSPVLVNGMPALADGTALDYLFSDGTYATLQNGANISGLFTYDAETGTYSFDSRKNHAQFDASSNTFTVYQQRITSDFLAYPFGNFLPFNDLIRQSAQVSAMDRSYLQEIAQSAQARYELGQGDAYGTLSTQLTALIAQLDEQYGTDWTALDAAGESLANPELFYSIDYDEATDHHFGMELGLRFRQPENGLTGTESTVFRFTGNDDAWVYVDGVLFLDLSGIHRQVGGEIDFTDGVIRYYAFDAATGDTMDEPYRTVTFEEAFRVAYAADSAELTAALENLNDKGTFNNDSIHSLDFYSLQRSTGSSVFSMDFNLPLVKQNSIAVEMVLTDDDGTDATEFLGDPDYTFQILTEDHQSFFDVRDPAGSRWAYSLYDADGTPIQEVRVTQRNEDGSIKTLTVYNARGQILRTITQTRSEDTGNIETEIVNYPDNGSVLTVDTDGRFTLRPGQRAEFIGIPENWGSYYVRQVLADHETAQYGSITVGGAADTASAIRDTVDGSMVFRFENTIRTANLGKLAVTQVLDPGGYDCPDPDTAFRYLVTVDGTPLPVGTAYTISDGSTAAVDQAGTITLKAGQTAVISNILAGSRFEVTEDPASAKGYRVAYAVTGAADSDIIPAGAITEVTVTNTVTGAAVTIPVTNRFTNDDGSEHTSTFHLVQVSDAQGTELPGGTSQEKTVTFDSETSGFHFDLNYAAHEFDTLPATVYYAITQAEASGSLTNGQRYIAQIRISESGNGIEAALEQMWVYNSASGSYEVSASGSADFVNTLVSDLVITTRVSGPSGLCFDYTITLSDGQIYIATLTDTDGTTEALELDFTDGTEVVSIADGQTLTIHDIPCGTAWTVTQMDSEGFILRTVITSDSGRTPGVTAETSGTVGSGTTQVDYASAQTYALPKTGGTGTTLYAMAGLMLMLCSAAFLLYRSQKRRREVA